MAGDASLPTSPLTGSNDVKLIEEFSVDDITRRWRRSYDIDVSGEFEGLDRFGLYRCRRSQLEFFSPGSIAGTAELYRQLQQFDWYYQANKWEYHVAGELLGAGERVLELGCGSGEFLKVAGQAGCEAVGLELNPKAVETATSQGLNAQAIDLMDYRCDHGGEADVVCSFQVMEHVPCPRELIEAQLDCLRPGGRLIISVPNNAGWYGRVNDITNLPPHHVICWNPSALTYLQHLLPIELVDLIREPVRREHLRGSVYYSLMHRRGMAGLATWKRKAAALVTRLGVKAVNLTDMARFIDGHTIMAVYRKAQ